MYAWQRSCWLGARLRELLQAEDTCADRELGSLATHLAALRCRSLETIRGLDRGERVGPATSIDKMILTNVERRLFDIARRLLSLELTTADDPIRQCWRADYFYSRMASVYGGTEEIQLDTIAHLVLGLPAEPRSARG